ncbi:MAG: PilZ domain-containing protein [Cyanobacteriota bacterium]
MRKNFKLTLIILAILIIPALIVFIAAAGSYHGHFLIFQYLFSSDASATWDITANYTGDLGRQLWPDTSLFIPTGWQAIVSIILIVIALLLSWMNPDNQKVRIACMLLAIVTCIRHLLWRGMFTLDFNNIANAVVGVIVYFAEISAFFAMVLGYFQMYKPTKSPYIDITQMQKEQLPSVDVYITTYNEGTDILYRSIVGALNIDYPNKTVYILDDGNRPEVRELCNHLGCQYITRPSNEHAKAGNMNNALHYTKGDLVAIFDADHVSTITFLHETVGYFLKDQKVAYVQTPQHFYTPDPFQRNLVVEKSVTNEQDLFYHVIQPGNNYWGSTFFAGSGAIFRRRYLEDIGGFAIETITEDTHTGIRLHAKGYKSYYVNKNLAAGMAQDSFLDYLNQRLRWGRGMFQILRYDNPLFVPGLKLSQRLCYFSGIYYFFHGLPRIIFLMAPLCFLAGGLKPIDAGIIEMVIYYAPSFMIGMLTFSVITKGIRQTFWSEVYETATALFLFMTTSMAIISPKRARFKVTPKGTIATEAKFDWFTVLPQLILASLTVIGLVLGVVRMIITPTYIGGILPNIFWASYNVVLLIGAIIVAANRPQYRSSPRIFRKVRCELSLIDGTYAVGYTTNISETGLAIVLERPVPVSDVVTLRITDTEISLNTTITGQVVRSSIDRREHHYLGLRLVNRTDSQHQNLVRHMFTAPSTWANDWMYERKTSASFGKLMSTLLRWGAAEEVPFHRVAPRFDKSLSCVLIYENQTVVGITSEISESGASIKTSGVAPFNIGSLINARVQWEDSKITELKCQVVRLLKSSPDSLSVGIKFLNLNIEQKLGIINHLYGHNKELVRVAPNFRKILNCLILKTGSTSPIPGYTYEISETSVTVGIKSAPFSPSEIVNLTLQWEDMSRQEFSCKVLNLYEDSDNYLVRLSFSDLTQQSRQDLIKRLYAKVDEEMLDTVKV